MAAGRWWTAWSRCWARMAGLGWPSLASSPGGRFANGKIDLVEVEGLGDLIGAETRRSGGRLCSAWMAVPSR